MHTTSVLRDVSLDDKYELAKDDFLLSGTEALVRLLLMQKLRDQRAGLNTAGYVSGYRGSPLGSIDQALEGARPYLDRYQIEFLPGVNEDLAATAIWGTQQLGLLPGARHDGVFSMWYGKGPGVDRSGDVFKHANVAGTSPNGGVLVAFGDDHNGESSTLAHQSEFALTAAMIPILYPASVAEVLEFGLFGWAMSRYAGIWVSLKCVIDTVGTRSTVHLHGPGPEFVQPRDIQIPVGGIHIRGGHDPVQAEQRLVRYKLPMALAFARQNTLDKVVFQGQAKRLGIVAAGKAYAETKEALSALGLDDDRAKDLGIGLYKVAMVWPLEPEGFRRFGAGYDEVLFVEDKRPLIEDQAARVMYELPADHRPRLVGKTDQDGSPLLSGDGSLTRAQIARAIGARLRHLGLLDAPTEERLARLEAPESPSGLPPSLSHLVERLPYFCSGCPHNRSTKVPEGSHAMAGIGCSYMAVWMDRNTMTSVHMGAEGANWNGIAPFSDMEHIFQNMGDGTYFHSGLLAIRATVAAGVNITYKILYNDAVAMTGGQTVDGPLSVQRIVRQVMDEGVAVVAIVAEDPGRHASDGFGKGVTIHARTELETVQKRLAETPGTTVLIYDQVCAAEKRRRRKRGTFPLPERKLFINSSVCEGCGDCSSKSNCVSIQPLETPMGRKRRIDQSSCNADFTCLEGFCPSFVSVTGSAATVERRPAIALPSVPDPAPGQGISPFNILLTGVGGTGVVTVGAIVTMAAHLEGKAATVHDMTGLAQKNGAVISHIRIADDGTRLSSARVAPGEADLVLGCDLVVTGSKRALETVDPEKTRIVSNSFLVPTGHFQRDGDMDFHSADRQQAIRRGSRDGNVEFVDATSAASTLLGDAFWSNMFMLGFAYQKGLLPVGREAIERAIELNGRSIEGNKRAFAAGRLCAHDPAVLRPSSGSEAEHVGQAPSLAEVRDRGVRHLTAYQNAGYAARYSAFVDEVLDLEHRLWPGSDSVAMAAASVMMKLMAYKDEYEVGRLHSSPDFEHELQAAFAGGYKLRYHLAPPLLSRRDPNTGEPRKMSFGPWMKHVFRFLASLKGLRGTPFDLFGYSRERRTERALPSEYAALVRRALSEAGPESRDTVLELVRLAGRIRGFGHVKDRSIAEVRQEQARLLAALHGADGSEGAGQGDFPNETNNKKAVEETVL